MPEEQEAVKRTEGLKGKVAVEGMLRCLSEHRAAQRPPASEPKDTAPETEA